MSELKSEPVRTSLRRMPATVWTLYVAAVINRLGNSAIVFLAVHLRTIGFTPGESGVVLTAYGLGGLISSALGGYLADRWPRQNVIAGSAVLACAGFVLLGTCHDYGSMIALSLATGVTAEMYRPAANVLVAELVPPEQRVVAFVGYRLFTNLGFAVGPVIAGFLAGGNSATVFLVAAGSCLVYAALVLFGVRSPGGGRSTGGRLGGSALPVIIRNGRFLTFLCGWFLVMCVLMQYQSTFGLFTADLGASQSQFGLLVGLNGILVVALSIPFAAATARLRSSRAIALGFALAGAGFGVNFFAGNVATVMFAVAVATVGEVIFLPRGTSYVIEIAPVEMRARYMSTLEGAWSLALLVSPGVGIALYEGLGNGFWLVCAAAGVVAALAMHLANSERPQVALVHEHSP